MEFELIALPELSQHRWTVLLGASLTAALAQAVAARTRRAYAVGRTVPCPAQLACIFRSLCPCRTPTYTADQLQRCRGSAGGGDLLDGTRREGVRRDLQLDATEVAGSENLHRSALADSAGLDQGLG